MSGAGSESRKCRECGHSYPLRSGFHRGPMWKGKRTYRRVCRFCRCEQERQRWAGKQAAKVAA